MKDLHILPRVRDSWSYLYVEHGRIDQEDKAIAVHTVEGTIPIPCATLSLLMLGPGTNISHAAIRVLAESGCSVLWTGEEGVRCYAQGLGETRSSQHHLQQARLCIDPALHLKVVRTMYQMRFPDPLETWLNLEQIRGREGMRVRAAYARVSQETGVPWRGRSYERSQWDHADPVNRALSSANSCLYGICHAAIVSAGYSPALGFIHTGKSLSFVYDIADLYKVEMTIPLAFKIAAEAPADIEGRIRRRCRDVFHDTRLLARIVDDIDHVLTVDGAHPDDGEPNYDTDEAAPGGIWDTTKVVEGGINHAGTEEMDG